MFEDKHNIEESDILMRSILSQAQEEVPGHVWDGIAKELDRTDMLKARRPVVLWFRRTAIAVAAAAAVVIGVFVNHGDNGEFVPAADGDMIAVVEPQEVTKPQEKATALEAVPAAAASEGRKTPVYLADAAEDVAKAKLAAENVIMAEEAMLLEDSMTEQPEEPAVPVRSEEPAKADEKVQIEDTTPQKEYFPEEWPEDDIEAGAEKQGVRTSIVLSGLTGTNNSQSKTGGAFLRQPSIGQTKPKTGIKETSTQSTYGLPLSAGVGVRLDFTPEWSLGVGLNYSLLTRRFYGNYTLVNDEGAVETSVSSDIRNSQQYIGIPVNVFYNVLDSEYMNFYAYAGGTVEKCFSDKYDLLNTDIVHKETVTGVQLSANVGIGVEFQLGQHLGLYIDPSLRYYFNNGQPKSIRTAQPLMLGFEMGLRVRL